MIEYPATAATPPVYELAEGIIWDDRDDLVRWVDLWEGRVLAGTLTDDALTVTDTIMLGQAAAAVGLARDGGLVVAAARGLAVISPDGAVSFGPDLIGERTGVRLNDGRPDPQGRFVTGTLTFEGKGALDVGDEVLLRVSPDGATEVLREGVRLSNGIGFSPDGRTVYHADTFAKTVSTHSYGPGRFDRTEPWVPLITEFDGHPDGLTVDAAGTIWVAEWGGHRVRQFSPTGELLATVSVGAAQVSCPGFVRPGLDTLAITTAQEGLTEFDDQAGAIFLADVDGVGQPPYRWGGSTTEPYWAGI
jgi:sugar lactone lactonase YvrE